nr:MFS transporter [Neisseriaceae bacterium]
MSPAHSTHMPPEPSSTNFPLLNLCALALTGFLAIVTEVLPAGLLPQISADLQISEAWAGQLITLYALGTVMAAIPLTTLTRSLRRKPVLL